MADFHSNFPSVLSGKFVPTSASFTSDHDFIVPEKTTRTTVRAGTQDIEVMHLKTTTQP